MSVSEVTTQSVQNSWPELLHAFKEEDRLKQEKLTADIAAEYLVKHQQVHPYVDEGEPAAKKQNTHPYIEPPLEQEKTDSELKQLIEEVLRRAAPDENRNHYSRFSDRFADAARALMASGGMDRNNKQVADILMRADQSGFALIAEQLIGLDNSRIAAASQHSTALSEITNIQGQQPSADTPQTAEGRLNDMLNNGFQVLEVGEHSRSLITKAIQEGILQRQSESAVAY